MIVFHCADPGLVVVFPRLIVPMETAQFMLLFLDALLTYATKLDFKGKGTLIINVVVTTFASHAIKRRFSTPLSRYQA